MSLVKKTYRDGESIVYAADMNAMQDEIIANAASITNKQAKITASGMLKGNGSGGVSPAVAGNDFLAPSALQPYRTASEQDVIDNAQDEQISAFTAMKGSANGLASLDANAKVPMAQLPLTDEISNATKEWLDENVSGGETIAIDKSLTIEDAAADAKATGYLKSAFDALAENDYNNVAYQIDGVGRVRYDNGNTAGSSDTAYTHTGYIDVSKYKRLKYKRICTSGASGTAGMAFYDSGQTYISGEQVALNQPTGGYLADLSEINVPINAQYARFSMLAATETYGIFELFGYSKLTFDIGKIGNELTVLKGSISSSTFVDTNYNAYLPVTPRSTFKITAGSRAVAYGALRSLTLPPVAGTNADFSQATGWTSARSVSARASVEGVLPDDATYLYIYYGTAGVVRLPDELKINGVDVLDISGSLTGNIALLADKVNKLHPKTEKTIAFFGDSIVAGSGVTGEPDSQLFHQYIHDLYGFTCLNYAYGGSGYIRNLSPTVTGGFVGQGAPGKGVPLTSATALENNTVLARLQSIQNPAFDAVVIFAGTNDWRHQDTYPYADFLTALENTFTYYQSNYGAIPLLVMTPIKRRGGDVIATERPKTMSEYRDAIIDMCKKYAVPYVDTMTYSGLNPDNTSNYNLFYMRDDTGELDIVHPNHLAHQRIARVVGEVLNQLVLWNSDIVR